MSGSTIQDRRLVLAGCRAVALRPSGATPACRIRFNSSVEPTQMVHVPSRAPAVLASMRARINSQKISSRVSASAPGRCGDGEEHASAVEYECGHRPEIVRACVESALIALGAEFGVTVDCRTIPERPAVFRRAGVQ